MRAFIPLHASRTIIPGLLDLTHVQNSGAAFGILNAADFPMKQALIALIATAALDQHRHLRGPAVARTSAWRASAWP